MRRRLLNLAFGILTVLSLLLFVAAVVLWVVGRGRYDRVLLSRQSGPAVTDRLVTRPGHLTVERTTRLSPMDSAWPAAVTVRSLYDRAGPGVRWFAYEWVDPAPPQSSVARFSTVTVSLGWPAALAAVPLAVAGVRLWRRRRRRAA